MGIMESMLKLGWLEDLSFEALLGHTITEVRGGEKGSEEIIFVLAPHDDIPDGLELKMFHYQNCCERVEVDDIVGEWSDIIGSPLTMAEVVTQDENDSDAGGEYDYSYTWTFYKLGTVKGYLTIKWYGTSNGYYSEEVSIARVGA